MFDIVYKSLHLVKYAARISPTHKPYFLQNNPLSSSSSSTTLKSISKASNEPSFTLSYLINSCGFSPDQALSASKYMNLDTPEKPDSVIAFFKEHGFTKTQIISLVRKCPPVLLINLEKSLLPKLNFFRHRGVSSSDIAKIVSTTPAILQRSLENHIIPSFDFFKNLLNSEEKAIQAIKRFGGLLLYDLNIFFVPNIDILREFGVPESKILIFLTYQPRAFMTNSEKFKAVVEEVKKMGFNPAKHNFILAIHALRAMNKSTWEKKIEVYKKWGLSDDDVLVAFVKNPWCMVASEDKIVKIMDVFVNRMGWKSSVIANRPVLVTLSLEKRIIPRCLVYQFLLSKGLIKKDVSVVTLLEIPENSFLNRFVKCYEEEAPELLKLYQNKLALSQ